MMTRRRFLAATAGATVLSHTAWAKDAPRDVRITRIVKFELKLKRAKYVGKNARRDEHGDTSKDRIIRIYTNTGVDGFGVGFHGEKEAGAMLGKNPFDYFDAEARSMDSPLGRNDSALWDLVGKLLDQPVYELLGPKGPERVKVYDGTIYMIDLLKNHREDWPDQFKRELDMSLKAGHRAFKIKIGRGKQWMPWDEGFKRDIEVIRLIRGHVGPDVTLFIDANNGYELDTTKQLLDEVGSENITFVEEMFPEDVDKYLDLKAYIRKNGWSILIADGESLNDPRAVKPWVEAGAVDILQGDMNLFGYRDLRIEADLGRPHGAKVAPHNWGSLLGFYQQLQAGRALANFCRAEQDLLSSPAIVAEGFKLEEGEYVIPPAPGQGIRLDNARLEKHATLQFDLKA